MASAFPRCVADHVGEYVQIAIHHLHVLTPYYVRYYVSTTDEQAEPPTDNEVDDRQAVGLDQVVNAITDLLTSYLRMRQARDIVLISSGKGKYNQCSSLTETMMSDLLVVAQITRENVSLPATSDEIVLIVIHLQEEEWIADVNAFIQEEDDESYIYNVRTSVNDLLGVSCRTGLLLQNLMDYPFG